MAAARNLVAESRLQRHFRLCSGFRVLVQLVSADISIWRCHVSTENGLGAGSGGVAGGGGASPREAATLAGVSSSTVSNLIAEYGMVCNRDRSPCRCFDPPRAGGDHVGDQSR